MIDVADEKYYLDIVEVRACWQCNGLDRMRATWVLLWHPLETRVCALWLYRPSPVMMIVRRW